MQNSTWYHIISPSNQEVTIFLIFIQFFLHTTHKHDVVNFLTQSLVLQILLKDMSVEAFEHLVYVIFTSSFFDGQIINLCYIL